MIVQTKREPSTHRDHQYPRPQKARFATVLRGTLEHVVAEAGTHVSLQCRGEKKETGEPYEFCVLLTDPEIRLLMEVWGKARTGEAVT